MSAKWLRTVAVMGTSWKVTPSSSHSVWALLRVRLVVPKQGIVTARMSVVARCSIRMARTVTSSARQLSRPPEMPITAVLAWA